MNHDTIDEHDFSKLLAAILRQALDDYTKLQHPKYRRKKYLIEAFDQAVDMFFDDTYRFIAVKNEHGDDMSLRDMVITALGSKRADIEKIKAHAIEETVKFWDNKYIRVVEIPDSLQVNGHVYKVHHTEEDDYTIDFDEKIITTNKNLDNSENEERFVQAVFDIILYHEELPITLLHRTALSKTWFRTLKLNNCFTGAD